MILLEGRMLVGRAVNECRGVVTCETRCSALERAKCIVARRIMEIETPIYSIINLQQSFTGDPRCNVQCKRLVAARHHEERSIGVDPRLPNAERLERSGGDVCAN